MRGTTHIREINSRLHSHSFEKKGDNSLDTLLFNSSEYDPGNYLNQIQTPQNNVHSSVLHMFLIQRIINMHFLHI